MSMVDKVATEQLYDAVTARPASTFGSKKSGRVCEAGVFKLPAGCR
jgi:hypothetical protein